MTAGGIARRIEEMRARGGRLVVVDPRRTETAAHADQHLSIRPGTDALLLLAMLHVVFEEGRVQLRHLASAADGLPALQDAARRFSPERVETRTGIPAGEIRMLARAFAAAPSAVAYGRVGTCTQEFGGLTSWLIIALNAVTGNLDHEGGFMFASPAADFVGLTKRTSDRGHFGAWRSRVRGLPEFGGELPAATLAEEIETPGKGQIRALITVAGNPVLSTPNGARLDRALSGLEYMVSIDLYRNETTRHADVILPGLSPFEQSHYDVLLRQLAIRNVATYSPPVFDPPADQLPEWRTLLRLSGIVTGQGATADVDALDDFVIMQRIEQEVGAPASPIHGRDPGEIFAALAPRRGPERHLDLMLRTGPYGDAFGARPDGLTLARLEAEPHGIDFGALEPRVPEVLRTPSGKIELTP